jgi:very-short-patch-repair endonuclease
MPVSQKFRDRARQLRRQQTDVETKLWFRLRARQICGVKFRRQHPIGPYIVDFCCPDRGLVVELDGGQHTEHALSDQARTRFLEAEGYRTDAILEEIARLLSNPHPSLSLKGRGLKKMTRSKGL